MKLKKLDPEKPSEYWPRRIGRGWNWATDDMTDIAERIMRTPTTNFFCKSYWTKERVRQYEPKLEFVVCPPEDPREYEERQRQRCWFCRNKEFCECGSAMMDMLGADED